MILYLLLTLNYIGLDINLITFLTNNIRSDTEKTFIKWKEKKPISRTTTEDGANKNGKVVNKFFKL